MGDQIRLSQCMIVKNEEGNIERALSWGREIMWEQIVVDTGSTDRTVEIAEKLGAKVCHFPWADDFAAAKNYAIQQAQGDWIAFLDADEYLPPEEVRKLPGILARLAREKYHALVASWVQVEGNEVLKTEGESGLGWRENVKADGSRGFSLAGTQIRFFCRRGDLRYRGRIHEKLYLERGELRRYDGSREFSILHTGYTDSEMDEKKKVERNIALIKKELEARPDDYQMMTYLGDSYFQQQRLGESAHWYEQAALHLPRHLDENNIQGAMIFKHLFVIYMDESFQLHFPDALARARKAYEQAIRRFPKDGDFDYLMGRGYAGLGQYEEGAFHLSRGIQLLERYDSRSGAVLLARNLLEAWERLTRCYFETGKLEQCANTAVTILRADPWREETLKVLLMAFKRDEELAKERDRAGIPGKQAASPAQVKAFLKNFYDFGEKTARQIVRRGAEAAEYEGLLLLLR